MSFLIKTIAAWLGIGMLLSVGFRVFKRDMDNGLDLVLDIVFWPLLFVYWFVESLSGDA